MSPTERTSEDSTSESSDDGSRRSTPRALAVDLSHIDEDWDVEERLALLWRSARLGPTVEQLRRHVLQGGERTIEAGQFRTLDSVAAYGPCMIRELAVVMGLEPSSATRAVAKLEAAGWVDKHRSEHDHREVNVQLTEAGAEFHRYFVDRASTIYQEIFVVFSNQERIVLADLLERMLKSTDAVLAPSDHRDLGDEPEGT